MTVGQGGARAAADRVQRVAVLFERVRDGESAAWPELYREVNPRVMAFVRSLGFAREDAEDAAQVAWTELIKHVGTIRSANALTVWMCVTTKREAVRIAARRPRAAVDETAAEDVPDPAPSPELLAELSERDRLLWEAVAALPARCRELIRLVALLHRPDYDELSAALGRPKGSIGPTRGRCLALLRRRLESDDRWSPR